MVSMAHLAVRGVAREVDGARVWINGNGSRPLLLSVSWGLTSDIDQESEWLRPYCPCAWRANPPIDPAFVSLKSPPHLT